MIHISVPENKWVTNSKKVVKVVLRGEEASTLPPNVFINALYENGVLKDNISNKVRMTIPHNKRKIFVYGDVNYSHRQTFSISYKEVMISFLLLDPDDARVQVTLLHMPIETSEGAIEYIFNEINSDLCVSDIKVAPGKQQRHDRWQLMIECSDIDEIPHAFILPNMGPEGEDLKIKVFVEGRKAISDLPIPNSSHESQQLNETLEPANNLLTHRSAPHDTLPKQPAAATPFNKQPIFTPTSRPRPSPSPNEVQPDLKRVRPENRDSPGEPINIEISETQDHDVDESEEERARDKARREVDDFRQLSFEEKSARIATRTAELRQERLRREERQRRYDEYHYGSHYKDNTFRRGRRYY